MNTHTIDANWERITHHRYTSYVHRNQEGACLTEVGGRWWGFLDGRMVCRDLPLEAAAARMELEIYGEQIS